MEPVPVATVTTSVIMQSYRLALCGAAERRMKSLQLDCGGVHSGTSVSATESKSCKYSVLIHNFTLNKCENHESRIKRRAYDGPI
jgi:hypothetical protein